MSWADKYVSEYQDKSGTKWKVCIPDGRGGQVRKRGFLSREDALQFSTKVHSQVIAREKKIKLMSEFSKRDIRLFYFKFPNKLMEIFSAQCKTVNLPPEQVIEILVSEFVKTTV